MELKFGPTTVRILSVVALVLFSLLVASTGNPTDTDLLLAWRVIAMLLSWVGAIAMFVTTLVYHFDP